MAALAILLALYEARRIVAREALAGWLRAHGVAAQVEVRDLGFGRFAGRVQTAGPGDPDFAAGDATVTYGLGAHGLDVLSVTLRGPTLHVRLHDGQFNFGALDPLVEEFRRKPPQPETPSPRIEIHDGVVLLATDAGPLRLTADATIQDGRLLAVTAKVDPAHLQGGSVDLATGEGHAWLRTSGDRIGLELQVPITRLAAGQVGAAGLKLQLDGQIPYPDLKRRRIDGPVRLDARLAGDRVALARDSLAALRASASFHGQARGGLDDIELTGAASGQLAAGGAALRGARVGELRLDLAANDLRYARLGKVFSATPKATTQVRDAASGDLRLQSLRANLQGPVRFDADGSKVNLRLGASGEGGWRGMGPAVASEPEALAAARRAARRFQVSAPAVAVRLARSDLQVALPEPVRLRAEAGATLAFSALPGEPAIGTRGGALRIALAGGGLPTLSADIRRREVAATGVSARIAARANGSAGPVDSGAIEASGRLRIVSGGARFVADRCVSVSARKLAVGTNDLTGVSADLCPQAGPMLDASSKGWRFHADARDLTFDAPFLQAHVARGRGRVSLDQAGGRLSARATLGAVSLSDTAEAARFNPLTATGDIGLADDHVTGTFTLALPSGAALAQVALRHDTGQGAGGITIDSGVLVFAGDSLQPVQISPLGRALGSPVQGAARFTGHLDWTAAGVTSGGVLTVPGLDFQSPAGRVSGLNATLAFASLAPIVTAPGQALTVDRIDAVVPITGVTAGLGLDGDALTLANATGAMGGGRLRVDRLRAPLAPSAPVTGLLTLEGVQLHDLVEASPFGDRVDLDATVSGRVPFESQAGKIRIADAELHAIKPGRLSIARTALAGVAAGGSVAAPTGAAAPVAANDTFTDFAYQAMENLAFQKLDAAIASRDDGRLGILAHVVGRHDPPRRQEIRLSVLDLIGRKFLNRPLPLPSDTAVDLTLDTTLNLDDLMADYGDYQRLRNSRAVQPAAGKTPAKTLETPR